MAIIRNRNGKWQAQVRIKGHAPCTKSFASKRDAERWARQTEAELEASALRVDYRVQDHTTMRDVPERYRREVTFRKRGAASENKRLDLMVRQPWAARPLANITPQTSSRCRDERLREHWRPSRRKAPSPLSGVTKTSFRFGDRNRRPKTCPSPNGQDAAVRPVEPAVRCPRKISGVAKSHCAERSGRWHRGGAGRPQRR